MGSMRAVSDDERSTVRDAYLAANPSAAYYIDFGDFTFFRLGVESIRYVGGYGRMSWVSATLYRGTKSPSSSAICSWKAATAAFRSVRE